MAVQIKRSPDGFCAYYLDTDKNGVSYITFQLEGDITKIVWAKPPKKIRSNTLGLDKESGAPLENRQSEPRKRKYE